ncbi:hypothetical protein SAMN00790413_06467 [Deinococcus hopiensis KR-140]|uniref:Uncharacterized protein n=1 Tax=Deinococcus hopiensis KR-140 TaxID=695939 RepID=A0A1W1UAF3_9DEIO|nr:hypothetical protein SAMN00790413_06467 [Deinococcus hopiensis KR-140]
MPTTTNVLERAVPSGTHVEQLAHASPEKPLPLRSRTALMELVGRARPSPIGRSDPRLSAVRPGRARASVTATGMNTKIGHSSELFRRTWAEASRPGLFLFLSVRLALTL